MSITVFVPTVGRDSLPRCLEALSKQDWQPGDEVLLLSDAEHDKAAALWGVFNLPGCHIATPHGPLGYWGYGLLNRYDRYAAGTHACHVREDCVMAEGAVTALHAAALRRPDALHLFQLIDYPGHTTYWRKQAIELGEVTGENALYPNDTRLHGRWGWRHAGDYDFLSHASKLYPVEWHTRATLIHEPPADWPVSLCTHVCERNINGNV